MSSVDKLYKDVLIVTRIRRALLPCITSVENVHTCTSGFCSTGLYLTATPVWGMFHKKLLGCSRLPFLLPTINVSSESSSECWLYPSRQNHPLASPLLIHHMSPKVSGDTQTLLVTNACSDITVNCLNSLPVVLKRASVTFVALCMQHCRHVIWWIVTILFLRTLTLCVRCHVGQS